jgi:hypothetical protein
MNNARINGKNREQPLNTNSTGLPSPLLFLILKRLESVRPGDNHQQGLPR